MKLIAGLGNPGRRYAHTRHNVGFDVAAELSGRYASGPPRNRFQAEVSELVVLGERGLVVCPQTYMNRSGGSVRQAVDFYRMAPSDVLVVCDDFHLPVGRLRFRSRGSSGGQKGLADILRCLGTEQVSRLRIGVGSPPPGWDVADYVLSRFGEDETPIIQVAVQQAADAVADWLGQGIEYCMNRYNAG